MTYVAVGFGVAGILFGINCYVHLYRWAKMCQRATIAIAYNRRVQLNAPLTEWLAWCNQLDSNESAKGRVVYRNNKMSVAILRPEANMSARTTFKKVRKFRRAGKGTVAT